MDGLEYIFVGSVLGLLAVMIGGAWLVRRTRRRAWSALAHRHGFEVRDRDGPALVAALRALPLMSSHARELVVETLVVGSYRSIAVRAFDVRRVANPGTRMARHSAHTVVALHCPGAHMPAFATRPRFPGSAWLSRMLDHEEIAIAERPRFQLFGTDERAATPVVLAAIEACPEVANTCVEGRGEWLLVYSARGRDAVANVEARIGAAARIAEALLAPAEPTRAGR